MNIYAIVTPFVILLIFAEFFYCIWKKNGYYTFQDTISSIGTAIINQCTNLAVGYLVYKNYSWVYQNFRITEQQTTWWSITILFFGVDFLFYWFHRFGHTLNILWAAHMPHHSTEELNYAVGLRASVTQRLASFIFYWPLVIVGFSALQILPMVAFHLVLQLIPHTRVVPKLHPWIEAIFNTPSHHRVHHACNKQYRDKNFGGFLIIWDKIFGTYEEEIETPFYGVTKPPKTWDPTFINFQTFIEIFNISKQFPNLWDKIKIWFMPLGWRPKGYPVEKPIMELTAATQVKYSSNQIPGTNSYLLLQALYGLFVMYFVIYDKSPFSVLEKTMMTVFLWWMGTIWAQIMEGKIAAIKYELIRIFSMGMFIAFLINKHHLHKTWQVGLVIYSLVCIIMLFKNSKLDLEA